MPGIGDRGRQNEAIGQYLSPSGLGRQEGTTQGGHDDDIRNLHFASVRCRAPRATSPRRRREHRRDDHRGLRFFALRSSRAARLRQALLPVLRSAGRNAAGLRHLRRRFRLPAGRRRAVWPLRRPHRAQGDADRNPATDRSVDLRGRLCAQLCLDRHLGGGDPYDRALHSGHGYRRRMGWRDANRDGMGED